MGDRRMEWFNNFVRSMKGLSLQPATGEWVVKAMTVVGFADGQFVEAEVERVAAIVKNNPVITNSLGAGKADKVFSTYVEELRQGPLGKLPIWTDELIAAAGDIEEEERNNAFGTLVAMARADHDLHESERLLLMRLRDALESTLLNPTS